MRETSEGRVSKTTEGEKGKWGRDARMAYFMPGTASKVKIVELAFSFRFIYQFFHPLSFGLSLHWTSMLSVPC